jgi:hypothetical protein
MHLLLADDHNLVRESLKAFFERADGSYTVAAVGTLDEAITLANQEYVDIAVLDLHMPGMAGLDGIGRFRRAHPDVPVLLMSGLAKPHEVRGALAAGARGFVPKTSSMQTLICAVRKILAGELVPPVSDDFSPMQDCRHERSVDFTRREHDVLGQLLLGKANKVIARHLDLQEVTVKLHLRSIFRKLGVQSRTQALLAAVTLGFIQTHTTYMEENRR